MGSIYSWSTSYSVMGIGFPLHRALTLGVAPATPAHAGTARPQSGAEPVHLRAQVSADRRSPQFMQHNGEIDPDARTE